jgi:hypothetical protein
VKETEKKTDANGRIVMQNLPIGLYNIEVKGNAFFQSSQKSVNIVNEEDKDEIVIFVGLKPRIDTDIEFAFVHDS